MAIRKLILSGLESSEEFHELVIRDLGFPDYYGRNLDAFDDCISDFCSSDTIVIYGFHDLSLSIQTYVGRYIDVMKELAKESGGLFKITMK